MAKKADKEADKREAIEYSLMDQLAMMGAMKDHYIDLLNDYMGFWDVKNALLYDIKLRGVTYKDFSSVGIEMSKNNPSVKELVMVNRQMLSILKELGLGTANVRSGEDDVL
jgi:phage terminase small subunit